MVKCILNVMYFPQKERAQGATSIYCSEYCQVKHCLHVCCRASWPLPAARQSRHAPDQADCSDCVHTDGDILSGGGLQAAEEVGPAGPLQTTFQHRQRPTDSMYIRCEVLFYKSVNFQGHKRFSDRVAEKRKPETPPPSQKPTSTRPPGG